MTRDGVAGAVVEMGEQVLGEPGPVDVSSQVGIEDGTARAALASAELQVFAEQSARGASQVFMAASRSVGFGKAEDLLGDATHD